MVTFLSVCYITFTAAATRANLIVDKEKQFFLATNDSIKRLTILFSSVFCEECKNKKWTEKDVN